MSACKSCGAEIVWAESPAGKRMPLDAELVLGGNVTLSDGIFRVVKVGEQEKTEKRYVSHFATCPNARGHRR